MVRLRHVSLALLTVAAPLGALSEEAASDVGIETDGRQLFEKIPSLMERATDRFLRILEDAAAEDDGTTSPPSPAPAANPTRPPTLQPTDSDPTSPPTSPPTLNPSLEPSSPPTPKPTPESSSNPTSPPTPSPTSQPSTSPPTANPTPAPSPAPTPDPKGVCREPAGGFDITIDDKLQRVLSTIAKADHIFDGLEQYKTQGLSIGSTTALIPEASDAAATGATIADGESGDTDFPHGNLKPLATSGERSVCEDSFGMKITGPPDGVGAYLVDDETVRLIVQSEGGGPHGSESYRYPVNNGRAHFGGVHVQYVDYVREDLANFMSSGEPASSMVKGMGEMIETVYNLKGDLVGPRRGGTGRTARGAHYGNTDANGNYVMEKEPTGADWFFQYFCSAHLEQKHQWGDGIGFEDDVFLTNEEWTGIVDEDEDFVGLSAQVLDIQNKAIHAIGVLSMGGFEKSVELNPTSPDYIMLAFSGYNGDIEENEDRLQDKRNEEYTRADGEDYEWPTYIVPYRIYVGVKGKLEDGSDAPADDFLARNGLKYGQIYGFAIDMSDSGPTGGEFRDDFHQSATNGDRVPGKFIAQPWRWDGQVRNFQHDAAWEFQDPPPGSADGEEFEGFMWWLAGEIDDDVCKIEHVTPDPRIGKTGFIQGSTCGYFGHLYIENVAETLAEANGDLPSVFDGTYYVYQGETDVTSQIELNGKGQYTEGRDATRNWDNTNEGGKDHLEDVDGMEVFESQGELYLLIQEDSSSKLGDRMFITSALEHEADGKDLTYYFVAMAGGEDNSRQQAGVGIPKGVMCRDGNKFKTGSMEFSGSFDLSGLLRKDEDGNFVMSASDTGAAKRANDREVAINDKYIYVGLQTHPYSCGIIDAFQTDKGGQWLLYQPDIPVN